MSLMLTLTILFDLKLWSFQLSSYRHRTNIRLNIAIISSFSLHLTDSLKQVYVSKYAFPKFSYHFRLLIFDPFSCCVRLPGGCLQCVHRAGQCWSADLLHPSPGQGLGGGPGMVEGPWQEGDQGGDTLRGQIPGHLSRSVFQTRVTMFTVYKWSKLSMLKTC